jgi:hypothetical protein
VTDSVYKRKGGGGGGINTIREQYCTEIREAEC